MPKRKWLTLSCAVLLGGTALTGCTINQAHSADLRRAGTSVRERSDARRVAGAAHAQAPVNGSSKVAQLPDSGRDSQSGSAGATALIAVRGASHNSYADRIARAVSDMPLVTSSAAVASGRMVLIGIALAHDSRPAELAAVRRQIRRRVLEKAPAVRYVYVTADTSQAAEIRQIAEGVRQGQALSTFHQRIERLISTMHPVPAS